MRLRSIHASWLAALIDGEGTVMLVRHAIGAAAKARGRKVLGYRLRVEISNTHRGLLEAVADRTGVKRVGTRNLKSIPGRKSVCYVWRANATELRWLLPQLIPYLIVKRRQAELLLAAMVLKDEMAPVAGRKWDFFDRAKRRAQQAQVESIAADINDLNRKGRRSP